MNEELQEELIVSKKDYFIKEILPYIIILIVVILIRTFIATPVRVSGNSMDNTLKDGEIMILNKLGKIDKNDIVVVDIGNEKVIKRVVAVGGDTVEARTGNLYVNGKLVEEKYVSSRMGDFERVNVPKGKYFVLGDNRFVSMDSRSFGPVSEDQILGTTSVIIFPFNKIKIAK